MRNTKPRRRTKIIIILSGIVLIIIIALIIAFRNINFLVSEALHNVYQKGVLSEVYDLNFENLRVDPFTASIQVNNVQFTPRENLSEKYAYINSSLAFTSDKMYLRKVEIFKLIFKKSLILKSVEIRNPEIELKLTGSNHVLFPIMDSTYSAGTENEENKEILKAFGLENFLLVNAKVHSVNEHVQHELFIEDLNIDMQAFLFEFESGQNILRNNKLVLSIGSVLANIKQEKLQSFSLKNFVMDVDTFSMISLLDTTFLECFDFSTEFQSLEGQTADSLVHFSLDSVGVFYRKKIIELRNVLYKPNVSNARVQKDFAFQKASISGTLGLVRISGIAFDSLIFSNKILIDSILIKNADVEFYKDKTKPLNTGRFPDYPPQQLKDVPISFQVGNISVVNANIISKEILPSGDFAEVKVSRMDGQIEYINNTTTEGNLLVDATGNLDNTIFFEANLAFDYSVSKFTFVSTFKPFDLKKLNPVIQPFYPVAIDSGYSHKIYLKGTGYKTYATGSMEFLYEGLKVNIDQEDKAKWLNAALSVAANTYINESNPKSKDLPPQIGYYHIERNVHREFINVLLLSAFAGLKETVIPSKENKKTYKKEKSETKQKEKAK